MAEKPWKFTPPKFRAKPSDSWIDKTMNEMQARASALATSEHYTDAGRRSAFTDLSLKSALMDIDQRTQAAKKARIRIAADRDKLQTAKRYPAATLAEQMMAIELARAVRDDPEKRAGLLRRVVKADPTSAERRFQIAFLNTFPELWGLKDESYHYLVEQRVVPDLGTEGEKLDEEEMQIDGDLDALREAKLAIVRAADRDALERDGYIPRPAHKWSREEADAFIAKNGHEAYQALLWEESVDDASLVHDDVKPIEFEEVRDAPQPAAA